MALTAATASIALSIGALLPLYDRHVIRRREMVAYILGAKVGTHSDSFVVAAALGSTPAVALMALVAVTSIALTVVVLLAFRPYARLVGALQDRAAASKAWFAGVLAVLLGTPVVLVLL